MPGIVGIIGPSGSTEFERDAAEMGRALAHEEFYTFGSHINHELGVYTGWVALDGASPQAQAFHSEDNQISLLLSGNCWLDSETGGELRGKGHRIGNDCASWVVHLYEERGDDCIATMNGLFSGFLVDRRNGTAFLFNDRYGVERLYVHQTRDSTYFASEAKALLSVLPETRSFDPRGVADFLACGCTLEWRTLFRGVELLPGGSLWTFQQGQVRKRFYFAPSQWEALQPHPQKDFQQAFDETLARAIPRYFESKNQVAVSLTGGLDSRMIMACRLASQPLRLSYTFVGQHDATLDGQLASRIAQTCGLQHSFVRIGPDFFRDFSCLADRTVRIADGYFGITGAHEIYLNQLARQIAPVRLAGAFGGEILRGVSTFKPMPLSEGLINPDLGSSLDVSRRQLLGLKSHPVTFAAFIEIPWNIYGSPAICRSQLDFRTPYLDNDIVRLAYQTPEPLRRSSLPAINLIKRSCALAAIPTDMGLMGETTGVSRRLRNLFSKVTFKLDYLSNDGMPNLLSGLDSVHDHINSRLRIFGLHKYLHYRRWFRRELAPYVEERLADASVQTAPFWNRSFICGLAREHIAGRMNRVLEINAVLTMEAINRLLLRQAAPVPFTGERRTPIASVR